MNHFNAFISYKHAPEDNKVAEAVQKGLEHFHIPGKLREKTGIKKINRIFRDKTELPITNDLSDNISDALKNSDYLIVICSANTKESAWVPREIEEFLKYHTKREIYTVLVNGEPRDVIPEILQYEERVTVDESGNEHIERVPIEPLSCDYRTSRKKAKKYELPRLVSGIIGCSYDEILNRHRQYRVKQMAAAFSAAFLVLLCFSGYMLYSRNLIHKTYLESLENQSKYLANESENLMSKENRISALLLALEALPKSEDDDRPVTAEAVKAITDATLAYEGNDGTNINAAWNYQMDNAISDFRVSNDGKKIAIRDEGNVIALWNTETHEKVLYEDGINKEIKGIRFLDDTRLLAWTGETLLCFDAGTGKKNWEYALKDDTFDDNSNLMLAGGHFYLSTNSKKYIEFDAASGKSIKEITAFTDAKYSEISIVESKISKDNKKIAFRGIKGFNNYTYGVIDINTGAVSMADANGQTVRDIEWMDGGLLMVATAYIDNSGSMSFGSMEMISSDSSTIKCVEPATLSEKWSADFECNGVMINSGFVELKKTDVAYYSGNVVAVYNIATGKEQYKNNVNESVIDVCDVDGDGKPIYITEEGGYAFPADNTKKSTAYKTPYFTNDLVQASVNNGVYVRQRLSSEVIYYGVHVYDDSWKAFDKDIVMKEAPDRFCLGDDCCAVLSEEAKAAVLDIYGIDGTKKHSHIKIDDKGIYNYKLLGIYNNNIYLGHNNSLKYELVTVSIADEKVKKEELFDIVFDFETSCILRKGQLIYIHYDNETKPVLTIQKLDNNEKKDVMITNEIEKVIYFSDNDSEGKYAVSDGEKVIVQNEKGEKTGVINCPGSTPVGLTFAGSDLFVLLNNGKLCRYETKGYTLVNKIEVSQVFGYTGEVIFDMDQTNNLLYIQMDKLTDVVDLQNDVETTHITNSLGHIAKKDIFVTLSKESSEKYMIGYYDHYSIQELIDKAKGILKGTVISAEMKSRYGIAG